MFTKNVFGMICFEVIESNRKSFMPLKYMRVQYQLTGVKNSRFSSILVILLLWVPLGDNFSRRYNDFWVWTMHWVDILAVRRSRLMDKLVWLQKSFRPGLKPEKIHSWQSAFFRVDAKPISSRWAWHHTENYKFSISHLTPRSHETYRKFLNHFDVLDCHWIHDWTVNNSAIFLPWQQQWVRNLVLNPVPCVSCGIRCVSIGLPAAKQTLTSGWAGWWHCRFSLATLNHLVEVRSQRNFPRSYQQDCNCKRRKPPRYDFSPFQYQALNCLSILLGWSDQSSGLSAPCHTGAVSLLRTFFSRQILSRFILSQ